MSPPWRQPTNNSRKGKTVCEQDKRGPPEEDGATRVRLVLNRPALERLIGGDSELEIALREQIVDQFIKTHLKTAIESKVLKSLHKEIDATVDKVVRDTLYGAPAEGLFRGRALSEHFQRIVRAYVDQRIDADVRACVDEKLRVAVEDAITNAEKTIRIAVDLACREQNINDMVRDAAYGLLTEAAEMAKIGHKFRRVIDLKTER